jgi:pimeloyl-ACP methyl ester carboxylesterase
VLAREHGDGWRDLIRTNGDAWLRIADDPSAAADDLYGGRLADLRVPTLVIHGARDPRTEPGELEAIREALERSPLRRRPALQVRGVGAPDGLHDAGPENALARTQGAAATIAGDGSVPATVHAGADPPVRPVLFEILPEGGHSPHSERATSEQTTQLADRFVRERLSGRSARAVPPGLPGRR